MNEVVIELNSKLGKMIRSSIYYFYNRDDENSASSILFTITDISIVRVDRHYTIRITSHRPGIIIGKAGSYVDELRDYLLDDVFSIFDGIDITFEISLSESDLWRHLIH